MAPIGRKHPALRRLRELVRDPARRSAEQVLVAEGIHLALEAIASGVAIEAAFVAPRLDELPGGRTLRRSLAAAADVVWETADEALEAAQDARSAQPVALIVRAIPRSLEEVVAGRTGRPLVVVAWGVQDPGNLGSLLRCADAAGATAFLACDAAADLHHPRAVRAGMGSLFRVPAIHARFDDVRRELAARAIPTVATVPRGPDYTRRDWTGPTALVLGREGSGLPEPLLEDCDATVGIPMERGVESLSVAAAGAVVLFEAARQRRLSPGG